MIFAVIQAAVAVAAAVSAAKAQNAAMKQAQENAVKNYQSLLGQLQTQAEQINKQNTQQKMKFTEDALRKRASLDVGLGESGVFGNTAQRLQNEMQQSQNEGLQTLENNRQNQMLQNTFQKESAKANAETTVTNAQGQKVGWTQLGLQIGAAAIPALNEWETRSNGVTNTVKQVQSGLNDYLKKAGE